MQKSPKHGHTLIDPDTQVSAPEFVMFRTHCSQVSQGIVDALNLLECIVPDDPLLEACRDIISGVQQVLRACGLDGEEDDDDTLQALFMDRRTRKCSTKNRNASGTDQAESSTSNSLGRTVTLPTRGPSTLASEDARRVQEEDNAKYVVDPIQVEVKEETWNSFSCEAPSVSDKRHNREEGRRGEAGVEYAPYYCAAVSGLWHALDATLGILRIFQTYWPGSTATPKVAIPSAHRGVTRIAVYRQTWRLVASQLRARLAHNMELLMQRAFCVMASLLEKSPPGGLPGAESHCVLRNQDGTTKPPVPITEILAWENAGILFRLSDDKMKSLLGWALARPLPSTFQFPDSFYDDLDVTKDGAICALDDTLEWRDIHRHLTSLARVQPTDESVRPETSFDEHQLSGVLRDVGALLHYGTTRQEAGVWNEVSRLVLRIQRDYGDLATCVCEMSTVSEALQEQFSLLARWHRNAHPESSAVKRRLSYLREGCIREMRALSEIAEEVYDCFSPLVALFRQWRREGMSPSTVGTTQYRWPQPSSSAVDTNSDSTSLTLNELEALGSAFQAYCRAYLEIRDHLRVTHSAADGGKPLWEIQLSDVCVHDAVSTLTVYVRHFCEKLHTVQSALEWTYMSLPRTIERIMTQRSQVFETLQRVELQLLDSLSGVSDRLVVRDPTGKVCAAKRAYHPDEQDKELMDEVFFIKYQLLREGTAIMDFSFLDCAYRPVRFKEECARSKGNGDGGLPSPRGAYPEQSSPATRGSDAMVHLTVLSILRETLDTCVSNSAQDVQQQFRQEDESVDDSVSGMQQQELPELKICGEASFLSEEWYSGRERSTVPRKPIVHPVVATHSFVARKSRDSEKEPSTLSLTSEAFPEHTSVQVRSMRHDLNLSKLGLKKTAPSHTTQVGAGRYGRTMSVANGLTMSF